MRACGSYERAFRLGQSNYQCLTPAVSLFEMQHGTRIHDAQHIIAQPAINAIDQRVPQTHVPGDIRRIQTSAVRINRLRGNAGR